ncbi:Cyclin- protein fam58a [Rhizopus azygosporus]|uniref:Cyclin-protein fam58a n=1 Tax=Rhizopus azygosporus TaxID=86630 RepID=A0A367J185_RHIAZ|nr:Cyclin- protein fam58a [Rhizopus azygosporus]
MKTKRPIRTTATAIIYYHRFKAFISDKEKVIHVDGSINAEDAINANEELLATTCLQLACKATEVPRKVRDLVNVGYRYYHSDGSTLDVDESYFKMRASLVTTELLLVRALGFDLEVELPFAYCLNVLRGLASIRYFMMDETKKYSRKQQHYPPAQKEIWKRMETDMSPEMSAIARLAWVYIWDSLCSPKIALSHPVPVIGLGCLYLALRTLQTEMSMNMNEYVDLWGASENMSVQAVRDFITDFLEFHDRISLSESQ